MGPEIAPSVVFVWDANLPTNLTTGELRGVDVRVTLSLTNGPQSGCQVTGCEALSRQRDNVSRSDGALDCSGRSRRARGLRVTAAQEDHYSAIHIGLGKVDVRHHDIAGEVCKCELEVNCPIRVNGGIKGTSAGG